MRKDIHWWAGYLTVFLLCNGLGFFIVGSLFWQVGFENGLFPQRYSALKDGETYYIKGELPGDLNYTLSGAGPFELRGIYCDELMFSLGDVPSMKIPLTESLSRCPGRMVHVVYFISASFTIQFDEDGSWGKEPRLEVLIVSGNPFTLEYAGREWGTIEVAVTMFFGVVILVFCVVLNRLLFWICTQ